MTRAEEFQAELKALADGLDFKQYWKIVNARILRALADGNLDASNKTHFSQQIRELTSDQFLGWMEDIFDTFQEARYLVNNLYEEIGVNISRDIERIEAIERTAKTRIGKYEESTNRQIVEKLRPGLLKGVPWEELAEEFKALDSKAQFYGETLGRTLVKGYGRECKFIKADEAGIEYFEYVGVTRAGTRPFCYALLNTHLSRKEIGMSKNGHGISVRQYCGGWNCHHDLEPDPFFTKKDAEARGDVRAFEYREGKQTVIFYGTDETKKRYEQRKKDLKR